MALFGSDKERSDKEDTGTRRGPSPPSPAAATRKPAAAAKSKSGTATSGPAADGARIGRSVRIDGEVHGDEDLILDGHVKGSVQLGTHRLIIGETGRVEADVNARRVQVFGEVTGNIEAQEAIELGATARVEGDIRAPQLRLEEGAQVNGRVEMGAVGSTPSRSADRAAAQPNGADSGNAKPADSAKDESGAPSSAPA